MGWYGNVCVYYKDMEDGQLKTVSKPSITARTSDNGRRYYTVKWDEPVNTDEIRFGIGRTNSYIRKVIISEVHFYYYDSLENDIKASEDGTVSAVHVTLGASVNTGDALVSF